MKNGITKTGLIHTFTDENECICDLNISMDREVSREYVDLHKKKYCKTCLSILKENGLL